MFLLASVAAQYAAVAIPLACDPLWLEAREKVHTAQLGATLGDRVKAIQAESAEQGAPVDLEAATARAERAIRAEAQLLAKADQVRWRADGALPDGWRPPPGVAVARIKPLDPEERDIARAQASDAAPAMRGVAMAEALRHFGWLSVVQGGDTFDPADFTARLDAAGHARLSDDLRGEAADHVARLTWVPALGKAPSASRPGSTESQAEAGDAPSGAV